MVKLHEISPREQVGRDVIERFNAQIRAASMACFSILEGKDTKKIYCEFQDDFVIEKVIGDTTKYVFVQVKTKRKLSDIWNINDVFGILKKETKTKVQSDENIRNSFIGKLLQHTINFPDTCDKVVFMTNTHVDDDIVTLLLDLSNNYNGKHSKVLIDRFNKCFHDNGNIEKNNFSDEDISFKLKKLEIETDVEYLKEKFDAFYSIARDSIYKYSEIDLEYNEVNEIMISLLNLVNKKSSVKIDVVNQENIEVSSGMGIDDLLKVLSISHKAYHDLLDSGDQNAIKSASIIERTLRRAGASDEQILFCSDCKIKWDSWVRNNRHILSRIDLISIDSYFQDSLNELSKGSMIIGISFLKHLVLKLKEELGNNGLLFDLDDETIIGGILSKVIGYKK
ncbi:dsDNA nuclease domain-containing protein [Morganella morganii]|uniref:dsDNA nuclease domain-containing protein n=1 Tax=Morganella morganii TaxID=582 RepID=UPI00345B66B2